MKPNTDLTPYGYQELRQVHQRNMMLSLLVSIMFQLLLIGGYNLPEWLKPIDNNYSGGHTTRDTVITIIPIPPIEKPYLGTIIPIIPDKLVFGRPVPMPGMELDTNTKFASQKELGQNQNNACNNLGEGLGNGTIVIDPGDVDPSPDKVQLWEKEPIPISTPRPEYPEVGMRSNIEGSVIVKVLLNNEGKVKKTLIAKTDNDIFNQAAVEAAQKWVFTPALMNGKPVQVWVAIPFNFRLTH